MPWAVPGSDLVCKVNITFPVAFLGSGNDVPLPCYMRPQCFRDSGKYSKLEM